MTVLNHADVWMSYEST